MQRALEATGVAVEEVDYINAHGTGTPLNDVVETRAIKAVFGRRAERIPVSSTKSALGHCLGAAGALEALAGLLAVRGGFVPATVTLEQPDPECDLDYVPNEARHVQVEVALSNAMGLGGHNACIVLGRVR
jgi:3-oxoacyl-(acyl-carrier-protein) synthase